MDNRETTHQLIDAIETNNIEQVAAALDAGADVEAEDPRDRLKPLGRAAWRGHVEIAVLVLDRGAQVDGTTYYEETALHHASYRGHVAVAELLVSRGASLEVADRRGYTPLLTALGNGKHEMATWLLDRGARMDVVTSSSETVLHLAAASGYPDFARLLQDANVAAMVDARELEWGRTALHVAACGDHVQDGIVRLLVDAGATVNVTERRQRTPLHLACDKGLVQVVRELLQRGAHVNAVDMDGWTPLMLCSDEQGMRLLLEFDAHRSIRNDEGKTARDVAEEDGKDEVVAVLDTYFPVKEQMKQVLLGLRGPTESPLTRFSQHSAFEPKVLSIVAAFHSGKGSPAFEQLQREAAGQGQGGGGGGEASSSSSSSSSASSSSSHASKKSRLS